MPNRGATPVLRLAEPIVPQIIQQLRQAIIRVDLRPGQALSEKEIALRFGVSRQPVREAFIKLAENGLVQVLPSRGTYVTKISVRDVLNARFVREAIECAIAREAAARIEDGGIARLAECIAAQEREAALGSSEGFKEVDEAFHRTIAEIAACDYAFKVVESARAQTDRVRQLSLPETSPLPLLIEQHRAIVAALAEKDAGAAEAAMRRHLREILSAISALALRYPDLFDDSEALTG